MRHLFALMLCIACLWAKAQLYDAQWVVGSKTTKLDFRNINAVSIDTLPTFCYFQETNANICTEGGDLLYYTGGNSIVGQNGVLQNGTDLSPCTFTTEHYQGLPIPQGALFIPMPGSNRYYYLFHYSYDAANNTRPKKLYYSIIDKEGDNGNGAVVQKNSNFSDDPIFRGGGLTAVKHANGRDYWLIMPQGNSNIFCKFILSPTGVSARASQAIGPVVYSQYDISYSKFSMDGSRYATGPYVGPVVVMDFDRCTGDFSNPLVIYNNVSSDPVHTPAEGCSGLEFSPNSRYLYVSGVLSLNQYDFDASNIQHDSSCLFMADSSEYYGINTLQIAHNGKIYGCTWNGGLKTLHVINSPDSPGNNCDFNYGGQPTLSINSSNLPNMINYKLGPLVGSGCDTIISQNIEVKNQNESLRVLPNPANKYAYIEMGWQGDFTFQLLSSTGQLIASKQTKQVDIFDTENLPNGEYIIQVTDARNPNFIATKKLVVVH